MRQGLTIGTKHFQRIEKRHTMHFCMKIGCFVRETMPIPTRRKTIISVAILLLSKRFIHSPKNNSAAQLE
jgi:hypothetical protein